MGLIYIFECHDCGAVAGRESGDDLRCGCGRTVSWTRCSSRKSPARPSKGEAPYCYVKGGGSMEDLFTASVGSGARGIRTPDQQEAIHASDIREAKRQAKQAARENKGKLGKDGSVRQVGMIPAEMFFAAQRSTGNKRVWQEEGKSLLKKTGTYLLDD